MNHQPLRFILAIAGLFALALNPILTGVTKTQTSGKYSMFVPIYYNESRTGYEMPPVQIDGLGGGKLGTNEKLKIGVSQLQNKTDKNIKAVKFETFIFNRKDLNEVLETVPTPVIELDVPALQRRECDILILYADDIPLLAYKPGEVFQLEVAVAEVYYDDGTIWTAKNLPGKLDPSKMR